MPLLADVVLLADCEPATTGVVELHYARGDVVDQSVVDDKGRHFTFHVVLPLGASSAGILMGILGEATRASQKI